MQPHQIIRNRLRTELDKHRLSAVELARRAGVKTSFIYDILNGKSTNPSTVKLALVAKSLGISLAYLAGSSASDSASGREGSTAVEIAFLSPGRGKASKRESPLFFNRAWLKELTSVEPGKLRIFTLNSDVMSPTLLEGDLLLINTLDTLPSPSGIFLLSDGATGAPKRLELVGGNKNPVIRVLSDNARYSAYERPAADLQVLGRVIWFSRSL